MGVVLLLDSYTVAYVGLIDHIEGSGLDLIVGGVWWRLKKYALVRDSGRGAVVTTSEGGGGRVPFQCFRCVSSAQNMRKEHACLAKGRFYMCCGLQIGYYKLQLRRDEAGLNVDSGVASGGLMQRDEWTPVGGEVRHIHSRDWQRGLMVTERVGIYEGFGRKIKRDGSFQKGVGQHVESFGAYVYRFGAFILCGINVAPAGVDDDRSMRHIMRGCYKLGIRALVIENGKVAYF
ncbi:hypothetical protein Tco_0003472 [Tanacetum coccineum]